MEPRDLVECGRHGSQEPAFVCRHLNLETAVGFDWNDRSEAFASPRLVCRACYVEMRTLNRLA